jgi:tripartite-type tricarboxylate transporter receptor subunit TctC
MRQACCRRAIVSVIGLVVAVAGVLPTPQQAWSQARTIRLVVPFAPAGGTDTLARLVANYISQHHGPTVVVENRPGAGTVIATEAVARAAPDGNTILIVGNSFVINPNMRKLSYDPLTSFEPICYLTRSPNIVAVHAASPYRKLADLIDAARAKPGDLTMAVNGPATSQHIGFEMLKRVAKVDFAFVPFQGGGPAVNALLGQHVDSLYSNYPTASGLLKNGKLRALAVGSRTRIEAMPDLPTVAESGYKDYEEDVWFGVVAPAKTPKNAVAQLAAWFLDAVQSPEIKSKLAAQELYVAGLCGEEFAAHLRKQHTDYGRIIREANIRTQ